MQKQPGTRFNAYDDLFSIRKHDEEDLQSLINHVDDAIHRIRDLRSIGFTLDKLDDELASMTLIRALPDDYSFVLSLLLKDDLDKMTVQSAFQTFVRITSRRRRQDDSPAAGSALIAAPCICTFCGYSGHSQDACRQYARAKDQLLKNRNTRGKNKSNNNSNNSNNSSSQDSASVSQVTEFAGNASPLSTSSSPTPLNTNWLADTGSTSHMTPHHH